MARCAWRDVAARVTKLNELHDRAGRFGERRRIGIALWLSRVIGGNCGEHCLLPGLSDRRHAALRAAPGPVVLKLRGSRRTGLPTQVRKTRRWRTSWPPVAGAAYPLHLRRPALPIGARW